MSRDTSPSNLRARLDRAIAKEEEWRTKSALNLIASENYASKRTRGYLSGDLSNRYTAPDRFYRGTQYADEVKELAEELARKVFRAKYADVSPLSGHTCSLILFMALLKPRDSIITVDPKFGGYPGSSSEGLGPLLRLRNLYFPFDKAIWNIVPNASRALIAKKNPKLVIFGASYILFPYDTRSSLPAGFSGLSVYDGSHVLGLIAGGRFQDPLREGASLLIGSTHKTLFGPQGGLIVANDADVFNSLSSKVFPGIVDNIHLNRVASLAHALAELAKFGSQYASAVIRNAQSLASALYDLGVKVKAADDGFTKSHQVLLDYDQNSSLKHANKLQSCNIIADIEGRLGTSEVTRRGMKAREMEQIAQLIYDSMQGSVSTSQIRRRVKKLVSEFVTLEFVLSPEEV